MTRRSEALRVVDDPYREAPLDRAKVGPVPRAYCPHCKHARLAYTYGCEPPITRDAMTFDYVNGNAAPDRWVSKAKLNGDGKCPSYEPSALTRLLRIFGLRKPVIR